MPRGTPPDAAATSDDALSDARGSRLRTVVWSIVGAAAVVVTLAAAVGIGIVVVWTHDGGQSASAADSPVPSFPTAQTDGSHDLLRWHGTGADLAGGHKVSLRVTTTQSGLGVEITCKAPRDVRIHVLVDGEERHCGGGSGGEALDDEHGIQVSAAHTDGSAYTPTDGDLEVGVFVFEFDEATWKGP